jgi:hypothetical protein
MTKDILPQIGVSNITEVESIYPCSSIQEGLPLGRSRNPALYEDHVICQLKLANGGKADTKRFAGAWEKVVQCHPTLRTRFTERVASDDGLYYQVRKHVQSNVVFSTALVGVIQSEF